MIKGLLLAISAIVAIHGVNQAPKAQSCCKKACCAVCSACCGTNCAGCACCGH
jgi:hypothetical protein